METIGVMQAIKQSLDPHWLMNPSKIFDHEAVKASEVKDNTVATAASTLERGRTR